MLMGDILELNALKAPDRLALIVGEERLIRLQVQPHVRAPRRVFEMRIQNVALLRRARATHRGLCQQHAGMGGPAQLCPQCPRLRR